MNIYQFDPDFASRYDFNDAPTLAEDAEVSEAVEDYKHSQEFNEE